MFITVVEVATHSSVLHSMMLNKAPHMKMTIFTTAIFLTVSFNAPANADNLTPKEVFNSDQILDEATHDISSMSINEMHLLADAFAGCTDELSNNPILQFECDTRQKRYLIEYSQNRAIDKLLRSAGLYISLLRKASNMKDTETSRMILRLVDIESRLEKALNQQFQLRRILQR